VLLLIHKDEPTAGMLMSRSSFHRRLDQQGLRGTRTNGRLGFGIHSTVFGAPVGASDQEFTVSRPSPAIGRHVLAHTARSRSS
jgi:hypothetical protein